MKQVGVKEILGYIPEDRLDFFAEQTNVDWNSKKLRGKELFKLCVFGILSENRASSRVFESFYENQFFCKYAGVEAGKTVSHSSIAERIGKVEVRYFEELYKDCVSVFENKIAAKDAVKLCLYDSTITSLSSSLLCFGMKNGQKNKEGIQGKMSIKFTVGFSDLPFGVKLHKEQRMISEDLALGNILEEHVADKREVAVFDRGMKDRGKMKQLSENQKYFVTRINKDSKCQQVKNSEEKQLAYEDETIRLVTAKRVYVYAKQKKVNMEFRLVEGVLKTNGEKILFLSNLPEGEFNAEQIAEIYKNRWKIEQFFRFIKQELNFKHYFSRKWNGIQVMTYLILIASILLLTYIKLNGLKGYKIPKISFCNELQTEIMQNIISHCGGDPSKLASFNFNN